MDVKKLIKFFKSKNITESFEIELDNLDFAKLIIDDDNNVVVENEHGTHFPVSDLSKTEREIFYHTLK